MVRAEMEKEWLEAALERRLCRVGAPEELWDRVRGGQAPPGVRMGANAARTSACATLVMAAVVVVMMWAPHLRTGAAVRFRSGDPQAVRAWVKANAGLDVPVHAGSLVGANVVDGKAEIAYRVGRRDISVLVSNGGSALQRGKVVSWNAGGLTYMMACDAPEDLRACLLCHVGS